MPMKKPDEIQPAPGMTGREKNHPLIQREAREFVREVKKHWKNVPWSKGKSKT